MRNTGANGGIAAGYPVLVTLVAAVIAVAAVVFALRARGRAMAICLAAVVGGALGNLADRLLRAPGFGRGAVVDWIHLGALNGSFNLADLAIQFGIIGFVIALLAGEHSAAAGPGSRGSRGNVTRPDWLSHGRAAMMVAGEEIPVSDPYVTDAQRAAAAADVAAGATRRTCAPASGPSGSPPGRTMTFCMCSGRPVRTTAALSRPGIVRRGGGAEPWLAACTDRRRRVASGSSSRRARSNRTSAGRRASMRSGCRRASVACAQPGEAATTASRWRRTLPGALARLLS